MHAEYVRLLSESLVKHGGKSRDMLNYVVIMRGLREDNDVKQWEVADYLDIDQRVYSRYERGQNAMPVRYLPLLCDYYNVSADYMLGRTREKDFPGADRTRKLGQIRRDR